MPIHTCGPGCYQYGQAGKKYHSKKKAEQQATAIAFSKARAAGRRKPLGKDYK
jgi:hypothetical protein